MAKPKYVIMPSACFIVARSYPDKIIGCDNKLPWHLGSDLRRFKEITSGHVVIMGRKTLQSIGRPLPNRVNVVVTREPQSVNYDKVNVFDTLEDAIFFADITSIREGKTKFFIIGGGEIYKTLYDSDIINEVYLTDVFCGPIEGDAYFPYQFDRRTWKIVEEIDHSPSDIDEFPFRYTTYRRRQKTERRYLRSDFLSGFALSEEWRQRAEKVLDDWNRIMPSRDEELIDEQLSLV